MAQQVTHVVFDVDGLLLDTERFYTDVSQIILDRFGLQFTWEIKRQMMGKVAPEAAKIFIRETGIPLTPEEFLVEREIGLEKLFPTCVLMPGAQRLVEHLKACGVPMAVATSSLRKHFELKASRHAAFFSHMELIVTGDDPAVRHGKPAPDIFLAAAARFAHAPASPAHVLVFEDAPNGVVAALAAGMPVVMVPEPRVSEEDRRAATVAIPSLLDFDPVAWGLPPFPTPER